MKIRDLPAKFQKVLCLPGVEQYFASIEQLICCHQIPKVRFDLNSTTVLRPRCRFRRGFPRLFVVQFAVVVAMRGTGTGERTGSFEIRSHRRRSISSPRVSTRTLLDPVRFGDHSHLALVSYDMFRTLLPPPILLDRFQLVPHVTEPREAVLICEILPDAAFAAENRTIIRSEEAKVECNRFATPLNRCCRPPRQFSRLRRRGRKGRRTNTHSCVSKTFLRLVRKLYPVPIL